MVEFEPDDPLLASMLNMEDEIDSLTESEQIDLHFALGASLDCLGGHERAFDHWLAGNAMCRKSIAYDEKTSRLSIDRVRQTFTSTLVKTRAKAENSAVSPIFYRWHASLRFHACRTSAFQPPNVFAAGEVSDLWGSY